MLTFCLSSTCALSCYILAFSFIYCCCNLWPRWLVLHRLALRLKGVLAYLSTLKDAELSELSTHTCTCVNHCLTSPMSRSRRSSLGVNRFICSVMTAFLIGEKENGRRKEQRRGRKGRRKLLFTSCKTSHKPKQL